MPTSSPTRTNGPRGLAALRTLERLRVDLLAELARLQEHWGDTCLIKGAGQHMVVLFDPVDVEHVMVRSATSVRKGFAYRRTRRIFGDGLLTSDGETHLHARRTLQPCLQPRRLPAYTESILDAIDTGIDEMHAPAVVDVEHAMARVGLDAIGRTLLGVRFDELHADGVLEAVKVGRDGFVDLLTPWAPATLALPTRSARRMRRAIRTLRSAAAHVLDTHQSADGHDDVRDFVDLIDAGVDEHGRPFSRVRRIDEVVTAMLAGHDTVSGTLTWLLHELAQAPELQTRLAAEVEGVCGPRRPTPEDVEAMPLVRGALLETLRLYPQCYSMTRTALETFELPSGQRVQRGWELLIPQWSIHRDARFWPEPDRFDPTRFVDVPGCPRSAPAASPELPRLAYFPFGAGRRVCIGQAYSMLEGSLTIARLLQRVRVSPAAGGRVPSRNAVFTLWPGPVDLQLESVTR